MPYGTGTYGSKVGRPPAKKKKKKPNEKTGKKTKPVNSTRVNQRRSGNR